VAAANSLGIGPLYYFGSEEQKRKYLVPLAKGEKLGCYCLSEPGTGSDASNLQTTCVRDGDSWVINGAKNFITNGGHADVAIVFATENKNGGYRSVRAFIVDTDTPGFSVGRKEKKLGIRSSDTVSLNFDNCRVPAENLLGPAEKGFRIALEILDAGRIGIASQALGIAVGAFEAAVHYAKERQQFGKPLASFQAIQFMLAEMQTRITASRWLIYEAAYLKDSGQDFAAASARAKLFASETAMFCADKAVQIHGGAGYLKDHPVERFLRDAKITEIYEGTSEIQKLVIARDALQ
jgi:butyryl-CoA dehydrogenase